MSSKLLSMIGWILLTLIVSLLIAMAVSEAVELTFNTKLDEPKVEEIFVRNMPCIIVDYRGRSYFSCNWKMYSSLEESGEK